MLIRFCLSVATLLLCLVSATSARAENPPMRDFIEHYQADLRALSARYDVTESQARFTRLRLFRDEHLASLEKLNFEALDQAGRVDYVLMRNHLMLRQKQLDHEQAELAEVLPMLPFAQAIIELEAGRRKVESVRGEAFASALTGIHASVAKVKASLEAKVGTDRPDAIVARRAARAVDDLRETLKHWNAFYAGYDPEFNWWAKQPYAQADKDLENYALFLRRQFAGFSEKQGDDEPIIGNPIGRRALLDALDAEGIPYTPEELIGIANKEFAWCEKEMKRAADDLGFAGDWHKALNHVAEQHLKPGEQPALIKKLADEATAFLEAKELVTVPALCKESWRIEMMSAERQKVNPYFTGGSVISVSFPTDAMAYEDRLMSLRGNNPSFCRATVFHELIPGHHLQIYMAERYNTHRQIFTTPFLVEGWALYWEMLMWEKGFPRNAEDRVGMLFWRAHRCARIIFSLKFHLGQMTPAQAIDFLVERVGHERRNATAEVRRSVAGNYDPLYQAAYMLGGLQFRALRKELVDTGKLTDRQFHDAILRENAIPVVMIRASLLKEPITRDFKPSWKFYDAIGKLE